MIYLFVDCAGEFWTQEDEPTADDASAVEDGSMLVFRIEGSLDQCEVTLVEGEDEDQLVLSWRKPDVRD